VSDPIRGKKAADANSSKISQIIENNFDDQYLVEVLSRIAQVPTDVPLGFTTLMEADDPKLVHYVQDVMKTELMQLGMKDLIDAPLNNLIVQLGSGESERSLIIQNYTPAQHHNLMDEPFSGKVASARKYGKDEPAVFGQGVSQNKAHQAVMLAVLKLLKSSGVQLKGKLFWAVNNEGRSSHECSDAILDSLEQQPEFGIIQIGTNLNITLGNRGRVDVDVQVHGKATHSSTPEDGLSAIEAANEIINRLKKLSWTDRHPILGGRHAIVYKIRYSPVAPHTLPSDAYITIDRRMLPGDNPDEATEEIKDIIGDLSPFEITVERGVFMLPALVEPNHPGVLALQKANKVIRGKEAETEYLRGTFDSGGPCARGVPTVMFGATGGDWPLGDDYVIVSEVVTEAKVLAYQILDQLL